FGFNPVGGLGASTGTINTRHSVKVRCSSLLFYSSDLAGGLPPYTSGALELGFAIARFCFSRSRRLAVVSQPDSRANSTDYPTPWPTYLMDTGHPPFTHNGD